MIRVPADVLARAYERRPARLRAKLVAAWGLLIGLGAASTWQRITPAAEWC